MQNKVTKFVAIAAIAATACACTEKKAEVTLTKSGLNPENFVAEVQGKPVALYTLTNENGMEVCVTNFGGRVVSVMVPDRDGNLTDVVLGFETIDEYLPENNDSNFGAVIGRYGNRIANGRIVIDGDSIQLPTNNFGHTLHGGPDGWHYRVFDVAEATDSTVTLTLVSPDGDANFPGTVNATVKYTLTDNNMLDIAYTATTDAPTVINLTNHSYFNLNGDASKPCMDNILYINAEGFTPVDSTFMTTGEIAAVEGTPMDFRTPKVVGLEIDNFDYDQLKNGKGYDHNFVLATGGSIAEPAASLASPETGIIMTVYTDEPGVQFYAGNFLDGTVTGKKGVAYPHRSAICLETQHYPDSPNKPQWPSVVLRPGEVYTSECIYAFSTDK